MNPVVNHMARGCECSPILKATGRCTLLNCTECGHAPEAHRLIQWPEIPLFNQFRLGRCFVDGCKCDEAYRQGEGDCS